MGIVTLTLLIPVTDFGRLAPGIVRVLRDRLGVLLVVLAPFEDLCVSTSGVSHGVIGATAVRHGLVRRDDDDETAAPPAD